MNLHLHNKHALVCGASRGIGKATALQLSQLGANVTVVARSTDALVSVLDEMDSADGQQHDLLTLDFTQPESVFAAAQKLAKARPVHILINNTGGPKGGPLIEANVTEFSKAIEMHLHCSHLLVQAVVEGMRASEYGRIINIISTSVKAPIAGLGVSNTTRGAMANWSKTLAGELGPDGITVNNVLPGFTATQRLDEIIANRATKTGKTPVEIAEGMKSGVPARRFASPEETANAIAFLASPAAAYINGINLPVDGGRTACL